MNILSAAATRLAESVNRAARRPRTRLVGGMETERYLLGARHPLSERERHALTRAHLRAPGVLPASQGPWQR